MDTIYFTLAITKNGEEIRSFFPDKKDAIDNFCNLLLAYELGDFVEYPKLGIRMSKDMFFETSDIKL